jgi:hypothetical protein
LGIHPAHFGIDFGEERRLESSCDHEDPEQQIGIYGFDLEITLSIRLGALAAIRTAGGSGETRS